MASMAREIKDDGEALLQDFAQRHPLPSADEIEVFQREHPDLAEAVMDLAMAMLRASFGAGRPEDHIASEADVDLVLAAMGDPHSEEDSIDLLDLITRADTTAAQVAADVGLPVKTMAAIVEGNALPPMPGNMGQTLATRLGVDVAALDAALRVSSMGPRAGLLKATAAPRIRQRSFNEIIADSGMSDDRKAFWLRED